MQNRQIVLLDGVHVQLRGTGGRHSRYRQVLLTTETALRWTGVVRETMRHGHRLKEGTKKTLPRTGQTWLRHNWSKPERATIPS